MRKIRNILFILTAFLGNLSAQIVVPQSKMEEVYEKIKTPYKYGLVIAPTTNNYKADCPSVFREGDKWYMTYLIYDGKSGKDGRGYETWLAESNNLLEWNTLGRTLSFKENGWDMNQRGGFLSLQDINWGGSYELSKFKKKYWMTYIGGNQTGYETSPLKIGLAYTDKDITNAHEWKSLNKPVMTPEEKKAQWFENIIQYKSSVFEDESKKLGKRFVMFYNAGGIHPESKIKAERIGIALSDNMKSWTRYPGNPVFSHDEGITGDAHIQKMDDLYVMFYFGAFRESRPYKAFNTFACSYDLINWTDWKGDDLIIPSKSYDNLFAHKSSVVVHKGVVYHFYCGVNNDDQRGIAVSVSIPMGRSKLRFPEPDAKGRRTIITLNKDWKTISDGENSIKYDGFKVDSNWINVNVPHNWDDYAGYRQLLHGNKHGNAWYTKEFDVPAINSDKRVFIRFEGIGTYATIFVNGKNLGRHLGGRTTFTLDVTDHLKAGTKNTLSIKTEHPSLIMDMPWVCGGCSSEWGFSEGSQPFGIFRPVVMEVIDKVRIEPFGVHIWNKNTNFLNMETEIKNYSNSVETIEFVSKLNNENGVAVFRLSDTIVLQPGETKIIKQTSPEIKNPYLWTTERPYLYQLASVIKRNGVTTDEITTHYGIRSASWPVFRNDGDNTFKLNGKPVFLNGVCEYEHMFGQSHAFSEEQIKARVEQIKNAGFNAFRDAHQPHHLSYQNYWDQYGILFWTQFSAHIWYDTPEFRENFKKLLRQWVKERRNSPSVVMWGLQNESVLPEDFAKECSDIIREMDPTAGSHRVITTCNGGSGTDWNVVQNWSGTYGGNPDNYANELKFQLLNGEYGAWRSIDLHTEGKYEQNGIWSENRMTLLMEQKIRLAESVRDSIVGQFQWIYNTHDNPGRRQPDEGYRIIDKIGPVNYKGLVTPWDEPLDVYYMYRANYASPKTDPMVYIESHTWADRWNEPGIKNGINVYSNCDEVELFNDVSSESLGRKKRGPIGTHFKWDNVNIRYNVLYAVGYVDGKTVAEDYIVLDNLAQSPKFNLFHKENQPLLKGEKDYHYIYRVNSGGDVYTDEFYQVWDADVALKNKGEWGSVSWANDYPEINPYQASQRFTRDPIKGTKDWPLFGQFRYGKQKLAYHFPLPDGDYRVELYFVEPWHGTGGTKDCEGYRIFDVAINDSVYIDDLDIWAEAGHDNAFKQVVDAKITGGELKISFPEVKAGQAVISAIAIASKNQRIKPAKPSSSDGWSWNNIRRVIKTPQDSLPEGGESRVAKIYEAESAKAFGKFEKKDFRNRSSIAFLEGKSNKISWNISTGIANIYAFRFNFMNVSKTPKEIKLKLIGTNGTVVKENTITFPAADEKWRILSTSTGDFINAGDYKLELSADDMNGLWFDALTVQ